MADANALKTRPSPNGTYRFGNDDPKPGLTSASSVVPGLVPSVIRGSVPWALLNAVKKTFPMATASSVGDELPAPGCTSESS